MNFGDDMDCKYIIHTPGTVVPHLHGPQLYGSPDYTDPILPHIHRIFDVH